MNELDFLTAFRSPVMVAVALPRDRPACAADADRVEGAVALPRDRHTRESGTR